MKMSLKAIVRPCRFLYAIAVVKRSIRCFGITIALLLPLDSMAEVSWSTLPDPSVQSYDDPFLPLVTDDIEALAKIVRIEERLYLPETNAADRKIIAEELDQIRSDFAARGIDADWLISQRWVVAENRERAASSGNPAVDGIVATLAGFSIPAPPDEDGTPTAYLVPERGMCSHTPPPNPNQMIRLRMPMNWAPRMMHEPVQVTGRLKIDPTEYRVMVVDGLIPMNATFTLQVQDVETTGFFQKKKGPVAATTNELAVRLLKEVPSTEASRSEGN